MVQKTLFAVLSFRDDKAYSATFPFKVETEAALIASVGLSVFMSIVPANIENEVKDQPRRPYLLALIMAAIQQANNSSQKNIPVFGPHKFEIFINDLVPFA